MNLIIQEYTVYTIKCHVVENVNKRNACAFSVKHCFSKSMENHTFMYYTKVRMHIMKLKKK